mmetsp:Transcript_3261/g.3804  ORF Transcript_3261/g.3804 Transcript_3261/m.3804 type:complete len:515 (-) Transcript_3261:33-1577(-)
MSLLHKYSCCSKALLSILIAMYPISVVSFTPLHCNRFLQVRSSESGSGVMYPNNNSNNNIRVKPLNMAPKKKKAAPKQKKAKSKKTTKKKATTDSASKEKSASATTTVSFSPSKVIDDDEDTPTVEDNEPEEVTEEDIPGLNYDEDAAPIPHQPWRRGDTDGCDDPISAPWRIEAEEIIHNAAFSVGASVTDVTWYMAALVISVDEDIAQVDGPSGPEIRPYDDVEPMWFDPEDPEPEDDYGIYEGEEDGRIETVNDDGSISSGIPNDPYVEREFDEVTGTFLPPPKRPTREEAVRNISHEEFEKWENDGMKLELNNRDDRVGKQKMSMEDFQFKLEELRATTDYTDDEMEVRAKDLRARYLRSEDLAEYYPEEFKKVGMEEPLAEKLAMPVLERSDGVDTTALSIIARAIMDALGDIDVEDRLEILSRHEIILTSPGSEDYIETQRQFDESRGQIVNVQTQDPFGSNRLLKGKLVDRNALDVYINMKGRLVTIPLNMVAFITIDKDAVVSTSQ